MDATKRFFRACLTLFVFLFIGTCEATAASSTDDQDPKPATSLAELSAGEISRLERLLNVELNALANGKSYLDEDLTSFNLRVSIDPIRDAVVIDMDEKYGPLEDSPELGDLRRLLDNKAVWLLRRDVEFENLYFTYGGKDPSFWFPDYGKPAQVRPLDGSYRDKSDSRGLGGVAISAGHGRYHHYKWGWVFQRDAKQGNGIQEDLITQDYAEALQAALATHAGDYAFFSRAMSGVRDDGFPWREMAARYYLENNYPNRPDIWNTNKESVRDDRELKDDINSRAIHANVLGVNALIHLHTNAGGGSGAEVVFHGGRIVDEKMAQSILCYMDELIKSTKYKDFKVKRYPIPRTDLALNRLASMPSVVVEVGYHSNPNDAVALQDPDFMKAAMKGVAKRL